MSGGLDRLYPRPHLMRSHYLVPDEVLVVETRATRWAFFPGPVILSVVLGLLTFASAAAVWDWLPGVPWLTPGMHVLEGWWGLHVAVFGLFALLLTGALLWLLGRLLRWYGTVYAITDHRVLVQRGVFTRALDEIPVDQIRGVDAYQSVWSRLFRYGTVTISSEGGHGLGNEEWRGVPRPFEFQRTIETMVQDHSLAHVFRPPSSRPFGPNSEPEAGRRGRFAV